MKAALWYARNDVRVEDVPEPGPPGPAEVILKVETYAFTSSGARGKRRVTQHFLY